MLSQTFQAAACGSISSSQKVRQTFGPLHLFIMTRHNTVKRAITGFLASDFWQAKSGEQG